MKPPAHELFAELRQIMIDRQDEWRTRAACKGLPVEWWFTERGDFTNVKRAQRVCADCPVRTDCFNYGLTNSPAVGMYGGKSMYNARKGAVAPVRFCLWCGDSYKGRANTALYCSEDCRQARNAAAKTEHDCEKRWAAS